MMSKDTILYLNFSLATIWNNCCSVMVINIWATSSKTAPSNMHKMCRFKSSCTCAKYYLGLCSPFIHSAVSSDTVNRQWRPWSDCASAQSGLGVHWPNILKDNFTRGGSTNLPYPVKPVNGQQSLLIILHKSADHFWVFFNGPISMLHYNCIYFFRDKV